MISKKKEFNSIQESKLYSSSTDLEQIAINKKFVINDLINENGLIFINGQLEGTPKYSKFRVVAFNKDEFNIFYEDKSTVYNIKVKI